MVAIGDFTRIFWLIHLTMTRSLPNILYVQPAYTPLPEWFRYNGIANENDLRGTTLPTRMQNSLFVRGNISPFASFQVCVRNNEKTRIRPQPMTKLSKKPEIMGTRTGYVIRFTCPVCAFENLIVNKTPRDHFKETRDASCTHCRKRSTILTPNGPMRKEAPVPVTSGISPML